MFWMFLAVTALAIGLIKLGALSVWVAVLTGALQLIGLAATALVGVWIARTLWHRAKIRREARLSAGPVPRRNGG